MLVHTSGNHFDAYVPPTLASDEVQDPRGGDQSTETTKDSEKGPNACVPRPLASDEAQDPRVGDQSTKKSNSVSAFDLQIYSALLRSKYDK